MSMVAVEVDDRLELDEECFGIRFENRTMKLPKAFAPLKKRFRFRTPLQLVSSIEFALPEFADELHWDERRVEQAFRQLLAELQQRFPRNPGWGEKPAGLRTSFGVMPPKDA